MARDGTRDQDEEGQGRESERRRKKLKQGGDVIKAGGVVSSGRFNPRITSRSTAGGWWGVGGLILVLFPVVVHIQSSISLSFDKEDHTRLCLFSSSSPLFFLFVGETLGTPERERQRVTSRQTTLETIIYSTVLLTLYYKVLMKTAKSVDKNEHGCLEWPVQCLCFAERKTWKEKKGLSGSVHWICHHR